MTTYANSGRASNKYVDPAPGAWLEWLTPLAAEEDDPFCTIHGVQGTRLLCTLWVGPMNDATWRRTILTTLRKECPGLGFKPTKSVDVDGKWNRVSGTRALLEWAEDEQENREVLLNRIRKELDKLYSKLEKLAVVLKPLCELSHSAWN